MKLRDMLIRESSGIDDTELHEKKDGGFNEWMDAVYDYVDVNLGIGTRFMDNPTFEKEARDAFKSGQDPYSFMTEYLGSRAEYTFAEEIEEGFGGRTRHSPTLSRIARRTPGGSAGMDQPNLDDEDGSPERSEYDEYDYLAGLADFEHTPVTRARLSRLSKKFGGHGMQPKNNDEGFYDPSDEIDRAEHFFGDKMEESKRDRMKPYAYSSGKDVDKPFGSPEFSEVDDFGEDMPDDGFGMDQQLNTGVDDRGEFNARGGFSTPDIEDPTSSRDTEDFGPSGEESEEVGLGAEVDPDELPSVWGPKGHGEAPGSDVSFPEFDEDEPSHHSAWSPYWDDRERARKSDAPFDQIRRRRGEEGPKGLEPRRKPRY